MTPQESFAAGVAAMKDCTARLHSEGERNNLGPQRALELFCGGLTELAREISLRFGAEPALTLLAMQLQAVSEAAARPAPARSH